MGLGSEGSDNELSVFSTSFLILVTRCMFATRDEEYSGYLKLSFCALCDSPD